MPQLLSRVLPNAGYTKCNAGDRPLQHNPGLGLLAMEAIISWSNVESFLLTTYLEMLGGPDETASIAYLALGTQSSKSAVIEAMASHRLSEENYSILSAVLKKAKISQKARDKLAHWNWGYSSQLPEAFLLRDPRVRTTGHITDGVYVFDESDFKNLIRDNDLICGWGMSFSFILKGHVANRDGELSRELRAELGL